MTLLALASFSLLATALVTLVAIIGTLVIGAVWTARRGLRPPPPSADPTHPDAVEDWPTGQVPTLWNSLFRLIVASWLKGQGRLAAGFAGAVPRLAVRLQRIPIEPVMDGKYGRYRALCLPRPTAEPSPASANRSDGGEIILPCYPSVRVFGAIPRLVSEAAFPLSPLALIHIASRIRYLHPIRTSDTLDYTLVTSDSRLTEKGWEVDLRLTAVNSASNQEVWRCIETVLSRLPARAKARPAQPAEIATVEGWKRSEIKVEAGLGVKYAGVSGDWNPHHLYSWTARLVGVARPMAHGMWSLERCWTELCAQRALPWAGADFRPFELFATFKLPLFMPSTPQLSWINKDAGLDFKLEDRQGRPHLVGHVGPLPTQ